MIDAEDYIGIPYEYSRLDFQGCDCWGLVSLVYKLDLGLIITAHDPHDWRLVGGPQVGDVAFFDASAQYQHVGVVLDDRGEQMLHTLPGRDACIEPVAKYAATFKGFYRHQAL